jgi:sporulation protein YqfC
LKEALSVKRHRQFVHTQEKQYFSSQEKKKYPFLRIAMASFLQIPEETLTKLPIVSITGQHSVCIENYTSVLVYETEKIVLLCAKMSVTLSGRHLKIICLNKDEVRVEGYILKIEYH